LLLSFDHFLPKTYHNLSSTSARSKTSTYLLLPRNTDIAKAHTAMTWERIRDATKDGRATLGGGVEDAVTRFRMPLVFKFTEALGWGKGVSDKALVAAKEIVEQAKEVEQKSSMSLKRSLLRSHIRQKSGLRGGGEGE